MAALNTCEQQTIQDAACAAQLKQCDDTLNSCLAAASPAAAQAVKCANACNCSGNAECACADQCFARCDQACQNAMDSCGQKQTGVCAAPGGG
jgi:hypothetical protein